jgi:gliding motility-associated-like protein
MSLQRAKYLLLLCAICTAALCKAQLGVLSNLTADELAQKLAGNGVQVFNVQFTGNSLMAGAFYNDITTNINIDSGIVLTTGRAGTGRGINGVAGNGVNSAVLTLANNSWNLPGDADLAGQLQVDVANLKDACVLEFDFIPIGDSISFRYVFSSEEYDPQYVCNFNDAFAFFISGPGIFETQNMALIPGTNTPVSISNINNVPGVACNNNTAYYVNNNDNVFFTHDGHTTVLTASYPVVSCQTYHLKLVIADAVDDQYDSGVFLEAKSLTSKNIRLTALTPVDENGNHYVTEGCAAGQLLIKKPFTSNDPATVILQYSGTAQNFTDVALMQTVVVIPAGESELLLDIIPVIDNLDEGIEILKITALYNCDINNPVVNDSVEIQVRDYAPLGVTPDSVVTCRRQTVQLSATPGYTVYRWDSDNTLSNLNIRNPIAAPFEGSTKYFCTATTGTCRARDSAMVTLKKIFLAAETKVTCSNSNDGAISISGGPEWQRPLSFSFNNGPFNNDSVFTGLSRGNYLLKMRDASGCIDSLQLLLNQQHPDVQVSSVAVTAATCSGLPDGVASIVVSGGVAPYLFSLDNTNFSEADTFNLFRGNYTLYVKDSSGCAAPARTFTIPFSNTLKITTQEDTTICEGQSVNLSTVSDGDSYLWSPAAGLNNDTLQNPAAAPSTTTKYIVKATKGVCTGADTITIRVNPAPVANAGNDEAICYNTATTLQASGAVFFRWQPAALVNNDSISNPVTDTLFADTYFSVMVTDILGCSSLKADSVKITVRAAAKVDAGNDTIVAVNQPLQLVARDVNQSRFTQYTWTPGEGLSDPFAANPVARVTKDSITYMVSTSTPEGCQSSDTITVKTYLGPEIYVPNAFTPDNNGINDLLRITAAGLQRLNYFNIYNRWGQLVFSSTSTRAAWDGKIKGKNAPTGTYVWVAEAVSYSGRVMQRRGTIVLIN